MTIPNSAAYLNSWIKRLKGEPKLVISAAAHAQKAVDYILNRAGNLF
jgi:antirestriction protein ArdC